MENKGLLFIPDISGFTRFVNGVEIDHSRMIIQELLEVLISANESGLEISEIEGDAILFYKFGTPPGIDTIYKQVEKMFLAFHQHLNAYELRKYCQCKACLDAVDLTLKVITHYGEFAGYSVRQFNKLIGKDVIVAHQLLKNDIDLHEYWLMTKPLAGQQEPPGLAEWMEWMRSEKQTEAGSIPFLYTQLTKLKSTIPPEAPSLPDTKGKNLLFSVDAVYDTGIINLFHASGDMSIRHRWVEGVKSAEAFVHFLPRVGMKCRISTDKGETVIRSNSINYREGRIEFSETDEQSGDLCIFLLESLDTQQTKLTISYYFGGNFIRQVFKKGPEKNRLETQWKRSLVNLAALASQMDKESAGKS